MSIFIDFIFCLPASYLYKYRAELFSRSISNTTTECTCRFSPPVSGPPQATEFNTCVFKLEVKNPSDPADMPDPMPKGTSYAAGPRRTMNVFRYCLLVTFFLVFD